MTKRQAIANAVTKLAEYYDKGLSETQIEMYVDDLMDLELEELALAIRQYRSNPACDRFPLPAKLIAMARPGGDHRPTSDEAWALIPKDEDSTVVWSEEMRDAFGDVRGMIEDDPIAARMSFRQIYDRLVTEARAAHRPARFEVSQGFDKEVRRAALEVAVRRGWLTQDRVEALTGGILPSPKTPRLVGPTEPKDLDEALEPVDPAEIITQIRERIQKGGAA